MTSLVLSVFPMGQVMARGTKLTDRAREQLWELGREARREYGAFLIPEVSEATCW